MSKEIDCMVFIILSYVTEEYHIWDKVFKSGLSRFCGRQPLKNLKGFLKGCLPQNLLSPLLNALSHIWFLVLNCLFRRSRFLKRIKTSYDTSK